MIQFSVSDNGCGVPAEDRERVFQPFVRLDASIKGSGIGLAIVKRIVEFYEGQIWIDRSSWHGCMVTFTLPMLGEFQAGHAAQTAGQHGTSAPDSSAESRDTKTSHSS